MKNKNLNLVSPLFLMFTFSTLGFAMSACGKTPAGGVALQYAPLSGSSAASLSRPGFRFVSVLDSMSSGLMALLLGDHDAFAATVSPFTSFKLCNDTLVITDVNGNTVPVNGAANQAGLGVLTFTSSATTPTTLTTLNLPANTQIKEIDITSAVNTTICPNFSDAVLFDPGTGAIHISQNTAFKFKYATPMTISGSAQNLTLLFGSIVTAMVAQGAGLNSSNIQTIAAAGTAQ
jgi:hypothetical protein